MMARSATTARPTRQSIALRRLGRPQEVAQAVLFLCSPLAGYITGTCSRSTAVPGLTPRRGLPVEQQPRVALRPVIGQSPSSTFVAGWRGFPGGGRSCRRCPGDGAGKRRRPEIGAAERLFREDPPTIRGTRRGSAAPAGRRDLRAGRRRPRRPETAAVGPSDPDAPRAGPGPHGRDSARPRSARPRNRPRSRSTPWTWSGRGPPNGGRPRGRGRLGLRRGPDRLRLRAGIYGLVFLILLVGAAGAGRPQLPDADHDGAAGPADSGASRTRLLRALSHHLPHYRRCGCSWPGPGRTVLLRIVPRVQGILERSAPDHQGEPGRDADAPGLRSREYRGDKSAGKTRIELKFASRSPSEATGTPAPSPRSRADLAACAGPTRCGPRERNLAPSTGEGLPPRTARPGSCTPGGGGSEVLSDPSTTGGPRFEISRSIVVYAPLIMAVDSAPGFPMGSMAHRLLRPHGSGGDSMRATSRC